MIQKYASAESFTAEAHFTFSKLLKTYFPLVSVTYNTMVKIIPLINGITPSVRGVLHRLNINV